MDLSVPIPVRHEDQRSRYLARPTISLEDCLGAFIQEEQMEKCGYKCQRCKSEDNFRNQMTIWQSPPVLVIHLKRFVYNSTWKQKLNARINVPKRIDMQAYSPYNSSKRNNVDLNLP